MKAKDLKFLEGMANDRIKEKENTLKNDKAILEYMQKNNIEEIQGFTQDILKYRIEKAEEYLAIARQ